MAPGVLVVSLVAALHTDTHTNTHSRKHTAFTCCCCVSPFKLAKSVAVLYQSRTGRLTPDVLCLHGTRGSVSTVPLRCSGPCLVDFKYMIHFIMARITSRLCCCCCCIEFTSFYDVALQLFQPFLSWCICFVCLS